MDTASYEAPVLVYDNTVGYRHNFEDVPFKAPPYERLREVIGRSVDIGELLFTAERDFLVKNNGDKVRGVDLQGKTIVVCIFPLDPADLWGMDHPDLIDAYNQMVQKGPDVEFVLVPVAPDRPVQFPTPSRFESSEDFFNHLFSTIPFPAVPFSDSEACGGRLRETLKPHLLPYWAVIDPSHKIVTTIDLDEDLFKLFGGDELYPLTPQAIEACRTHHLYTTIKEHISKWYQLLSGDFLLSSNGEKVSVSSLKGKVIGLYFCDINPNPPRMELINKVYKEAKRLRHEFEIVQINYHYHCFGSRCFGSNPTVDPCREDISWLTLPFKDPRCRKLQRIFNCGRDDYWDGDCLVIVNTLNAYVQVEYSGAEMIQEYEGVAAYPFTRYSLYEAEYRRQKTEVRLCSLFPPGEPLLLKSRKVNASLLKGKRVLVLFADQSIVSAGKNYFSMLKSKYNKQKTRTENEFELVYVATDLNESSFEEYREGIPWLVHPYSVEFASSCAKKVFNAFNSMDAVVAFGREGELIAKQIGLGLCGYWNQMNLNFPFIKQDLKTTIRVEVQDRCDLYKYCGYESDDEAALVSWNRLV